MMFKWLDNFMKSYQDPDNYEISVFDNDDNKHSLVGLCSSLAKEVMGLEKRIIKLEGENIELINCLYEVENRMQAKIDNLHPMTYNLQNYRINK